MRREESGQGMDRYVTSSLLDFVSRAWRRFGFLLVVCVSAALSCVQALRMRGRYGGSSPPIVVAWGRTSKAL